MADLKKLNELLYQEIKRMNAIDLTKLEFEEQRNGVEAHARIEMQRARELSALSQRIIEIAEVEHNHKMARIDYGLEEE